MAETPADRPVEYTVTAILPDRDILREYLDWLATGHAAAVVRAGALSARVKQLIDPAEPLRVESTYLFASLGEFEDYQTTHAAPLRAEGARLFAARGVTFERRLCTVVYRRDLDPRRP